MVQRKIALIGKTKCNLIKKRKKKKPKQGGVVV